MSAPHRLHVILDGLEAEEATLQLLAHNDLGDGHGHFSPLLGRIEHLTGAALVIATTRPAKEMNRVVKAGLDIVRARYPALECVILLPLGAIASKE